MASLRYALSVEELKSRGTSSLREEYLEISKYYNGILDGEYLRCPVCGEFKHKNKGYYVDSRYLDGKNPICKECLLKMAEQREKDRDEPNETKESVQKVLQILDRVYDDDLYEKCVKGASDDVKERSRSAFGTYITNVMSLPQWKNKTYADSDFGSSEIKTELDEETEKINQEFIRKAKDRFGDEYNNVDLLFLEKEYEDWTTRYACESKAQELLFKRICFTELAIEKAQKQGKDTKELDKTLQELMASAQLKPSQKGSASLTDAKSYGQLIEKWEEEEPIPEQSSEFKDVDKIGALVDIFFLGHLGKMMGLKNAITSRYEQFMKKYTVTKQEYQDEEYSEELFGKIFGTQLDD